MNSEALSEWLWNKPEYTHAVQFFRDNRWEPLHSVNCDTLTKCEEIYHTNRARQNPVRLVKISRYVSNGSIPIHSILRTYTP